MDIEKNLRENRLSNMLNKKVKQLNDDLEEILSYILDPNNEFDYYDFKVIQYICYDIRKVKKDINNLEEKKENEK